jgi:hypothetical protein
MKVAGLTDMINMCIHCMSVVLEDADVLNVVTEMNSEAATLIKSNIQVTTRSLLNTEKNLSFSRRQLLQNQNRHLENRFPYNDQEERQMEKVNVISIQSLRDCVRRLY